MNTTWTLSTGGTWNSSSNYTSNSNYVIYGYDQLRKQVPEAERRRLEKLRQIEANHGKVHKIVIV
jgi:hypothetical protein